MMLMRADADPLGDVVRLTPRLMALWLMALRPMALVPMTRGLRRDKRRWDEKQGES